MSEYMKLKAEENILKHKILYARRKENKLLTHKHKVWVRTLDIIMILAILSNIGAYFITSALVIQSKPDIEFQEANPVTAARGGFKTSPQVNKQFYGILIQMYILAGMALLIIWYRHYLITYWQLWQYSLMICLGSTALIFDFIHDLSFLVGVLGW